MTKSEVLNLLQKIVDDSCDMEHWAECSPLSAVQRVLKNHIANLDEPPYDAPDNLITPLSAKESQ